MPQRNPYKEALRGIKFVIQYYIFFCSPPPHIMYIVSRQYF
jgi:hypothetical protein